MRFRLLCAASLALLLTSCQSLLRPPVPAAAAPFLDVQQLVDGAVAAGQHSLTLPPGRYRVKQSLALHGLDGFTLEGAGCELFFPPVGQMVDANGCKDLAIRGITFDCYPLPFTQGTVTAVAPDHTSFEYRVHDGYPRLDPTVRYGRSGAFIFAPDTRRWKQDVADVYPSKSEVLGPDRGRITIGGNLPGNVNIHVGDLVAFKNPAGNGLTFKHCNGVTVEDVTVYTTPLAGFLLRCCEGPLTFRRCTITRGPRPDGATQDRLLSTVADGFNVGYSRQGPTVEECDFGWMGDDAVNLHGTIVDVGGAESPRVVWLASRYFPEFAVRIRAGDEFRLLRSDTFARKATTTIADCQLQATPPAELAEAMRRQLKLAADKPLYAVRLQLAGDIPAEAGDSADIPAIACPNFVFRDNYFHDHRARGLRLGASHGVIEHNRLERLKSCAISLGPHAIHHEGGWVSDIVVRNNTIRDVCFDDRSLEPGSYNAGAIVVQHFLPRTDAPYPQENRRITITGNTIDLTGGAGIVATSADELTITGNRLSRTQQADVSHTGEELRLTVTGAISLNYCTRVTLDDNRVSAPGPSCRADLVRNPPE